jgi:hypothetical protein
MIIITRGVLMSKKRMMSKQQRLYYEYQNKERIREELIEYVKQLRELEQARDHRKYNVI